MRSKQYPAILLLLTGAFGGPACAAAPEAPAGKGERVLVPASRREPQPWKYVFDQPAADWMHPDFSDHAWSDGLAPFGSGGTTRWRTKAIWLRKTFELTSETLPRNPHLQLLHDEDVHVYLNGVLVAHWPGHVSRYTELPIAPDPFRAGRNVLAVACFQTSGGQAVDVGIVDHPPPPQETPGQAALHVDFSAAAAPPLVKTKFGVYNCPYFSMERWFRDLPLLDQLNVSSLRYDPTWGGHGAGIEMGAPQITGSPEDLRYNLADFDRFTDSLLQRGIEPMYVMAYTPQPLQPPGGNWADPPTCLPAWRRLCRDYAAHWRSTGRKVPWYEIWNEPDNPPFFFRGTREDYFAIYREGALGVKEGDPDALVGGPAIAALGQEEQWLGPFLDYVSSNSLPLDFLSFHNYGDPLPIIEKARAELRRRPHLAHLPTMLTEYNSHVPLTGDFDEGGPAERAGAAARLLHDFKLLLDQPDVTRVYWAMFNDPDTQERCGLVSLDGRRKAAFHAFRIYGELPEQRRAVRSSAPPEIEALASADDRHAAVVFWNNSGRDYHTTAVLQNLPRPGILECLRIDRDHGSWYDRPVSDELPVVGRETTEAGEARWAGLVPAGGVVYLRLAPSEKEHSAF